MTNKQMGNEAPKIPSLMYASTAGNWRKRHAFIGDFDTLPPLPLRASIYICIKHTLGSEFIGVRFFCFELWLLLCHAINNFTFALLWFYYRKMNLAVIIFVCLHHLVIIIFWHTYTFIYIYIHEYTIFFTVFV